MEILKKRNTKKTNIYFDFRTRMSTQEIIAGIEALTRLLSQVSLDVDTYGKAVQKLNNLLDLL